jgi:hypothetical protein
MCLEQVDYHYTKSRKPKMGIYCLHPSRVCSRNSMQGGSAHLVRNAVLGCYRACSMANPNGYGLMRAHDDSFGLIVDGGELGNVTK